MVRCCSSHGDIILTLLLVGLPRGILFSAACRHQALAAQAVVSSCSRFVFSYVLSGHLEHGWGCGLAALILALTIDQSSIYSQTEGNGISWI